MAIEKRWPSVAPVAFTASGTAKGKITLSTTKGFKVKQVVTLVHPTLPRLQLEVKRVTRTYLLAGPAGKIDDYADLSAYDTQTTIHADEQHKKLPTDKELALAVYDQEPTVANRVVNVDQHGDYFDTNNPLPVRLTDGDINVDTLNAQIEVALDHRDLGDDPHDSIRIGDGANEAILVDGSSDAGPTGLFGILAQVRNLVFNGTTWERIRSATIGNNVTGLGLVANAIYGQYRKALQVLTDQRHSVALMDKNGAIVTTDDRQYQAEEERAFGVSSGMTNVPTTALTGVLALRNTHATRNLKVFRVRFGVESGKTAQCFVFINPTITANGTVLPARNLHLGSTNPSIATIGRIPTITNFGSAIISHVSPSAAQSYDFVTTSYIIVPPGSSIVVAFQTGQNNTQVHADFFWIEE